MQSRRSQSYNQLHARSRPHNPSVREIIRDGWFFTSVGIVLYFSGIYLTVWNEGRAVSTSKALDSSLASVVVLTPNSQPLPENGGRLVHLVGEISVGEPLTEMDYGVAVQAVKLKRRVQMFQWVEEESLVDLPDGDALRTDVNYYYTTEWRDKLIDSSQFARQMSHQNPREFPLKSTVYVNEVVTVGGFNLGPELKAKFNDFVPITSDERPEQRDIKLHAGLYYHCRDVWEPEVGDIRIQFSYAGHAGFPVTVVGMQVGNEIRAYPMAPGVDIIIVRQGRLTAEEIFWLEHVNNRWLTWALRGAGWFVSFLGCTCLYGILSALVQRNSFARDLLAGGSGSISMTMSSTSCLAAVALSWLWYRPYLAGGLLLSAALPFVWGGIRHSNWNSADERNPNPARPDSYRRLPD
ncbi:transmembrane protein 43 homolog [Thrips palmi]|uniref:Transmembrane protein 43 homolog n=1 Tax=Thrips palmi TaxID=161013 RepID=A0A6P9A1B9_THRPL|nr:transmembrane protein 43 homolog [Thrips palmi]XP_034251570.1 transmembrane protein 43 homolog [Thrips palmi]XP_034251571.1 transmembrane protein 43 homolog [Thrips palmi]XP_034251572.1 transmembrane protein 43 homolog [Thrips palmi]XP_034251573.1 transmembrane protein 43 homolog [Thrips palmi]